MIYLNILKEELNELAFLELKENAIIKVNGEEFKGYLPLPILNSKLVGIVQENFEEIPIDYFVEGMVYILSLNFQNEYKETYLDFIKAYAKDIKGYIFKKSMEYLGDEDFKKALIFLNALLNLGFTDEKVYFALGNAMENLDITNLSSEEKNNHAIEIMNIYEEVLNIEEKFSLAHYKLGYIYKEFGQFIKSKLSFEKFLKLDKNDFRLQEVREELENIQGEVDKEEAVLEINRGNYEFALEKLLQVKDFYRDDLYYYHLSLCYTYLKMLDSAMDAIDRAINIEDVGVYHNQKAIIYQELEDFDLAKKEIEETIDKFGPDYYLNYNLATIQYNEGDIENALGNFEIAYDISPNTNLEEIIIQLKKYLENK